MKTRPGWWLPLLAGAAGLLFCTSGSWIHAKALLAQVLLRHAWQQSLVLKQPVRPWPWADIAPVARLRVPGLAQDQIILDSQSGAALAFGPGMLRRGSRPGRPGPCVLAGHRDTSFRFLQRLRPGELLSLEDLEGKIHLYRVQEAAVRSAKELFFEQQTAARLLLVTCYPFDAILPGTPLRFVVSAEQVSADEQHGPANCLGTEKIRTKKSPRNLHSAGIELSG